MGIEYIDVQALAATVSVHAKETTLAGVLSLVLLVPRAMFGLNVLELLTSPTSVRQLAELTCSIM